MSQTAKMTVLTVVVTVLTTILLKVLIKDPRTPIPGHWADYA